MKDLDISIIDKLSTPVLKKPGAAVMVSQVVRAFLSNQRKALAKAKTRGLVVGSKSKVYRQKGTGRARHKDRQAPIFVGGGAAHGPVGVQNYKQKVNRKMVQKALAVVLSEKIKDKKAYIVKKAEFEKTKEAASYVEKIRKSLNTKGEIAFILTKKDGLRRFLNNLKDVKVVNVESLSSFSILKADLIIITESAFKELEQYLGVKKNEHIN